MGGGLRVEIPYKNLNFCVGNNGNIKRVLSLCTPQSNSNTNGIWGEVISITIASGCKHLKHPLYNYLNFVSLFSYAIYFFYTVIQKKRYGIQVLVKIVQNV